MRYLLPLLLLTTLLALACDQQDDAVPEPSANAQEVLPDGLILASAPEGAQSVAEVRAGAQEGQEVVVRGVVAGSAEPLAENRAILTLLDESIETCDRMAVDDGCETPWDACCAPPETISANAATVQVVDAEGRPLKAGLKGLGNIAPLSRVVIVGTFHPSADGQSAVINATGIHVEG